MKPILSHKLIQVTAAVFILLTVITIMYPPDIEIFKKISEFAPHLMFGLLFISLVFIVFNEARLMFVCMMASAFLAFFLKTASNSNMILPEENNLPKLKIAHFNLASLQPFDPAFKTKILDTECDIISFQEYTPDWDAFIPRELNKEFPFAYKMVRIDFFGMAVYSKKKLIEPKIFYYEEIPNLHFKTNTGLQDIDIISSYIVPPSLKTKKTQPKAHLAALADYIAELTNPTITLGDFNQVYWTTEIQSFREKTEMNNSRRNISLTAKGPYDHIFYSRFLECIKFEEIKDEKQNHLGIVGYFQNKTSVSNPAILRSIGYSEK